MKDYQKRVVEEKAELDDKLSRLTPFISSPRFAEIPAPEQERLRRQEWLMVQYSLVLGERIAAFKEMER